MNDNTQIVGYAQTAAGAWHAFSWTATTGMVDLGTLGGTSSFAASINNSGQVVGYSTTATGATHAFSWTSAGGMVDLGTLGGSYSKAAAASAAGQVVGSATTVAGATHAFSWTVAGGMVDLGTLPGGVSSDGIAVNLAGAVAGDSYPSSGGPHVFFWTAARGMVDVGTLGGQQNYSSFCGRSQCGDPSVLNATGEVVGGSSICCYTRDAFSWTSSGGIVDLGTLPGGSFSDAHAVNDAGQVVGRSGCACNGGFHAFLWTQEGGMTDLGSLGGLYAEADEVNAGGQVVGNGTPSSGGTHAFSWTQTGGMVDLATLGGSNSYDAGYGGGNGLNASGQVVGAADLSNGTTHAVLWINAASDPSITAHGITFGAIEGQSFSGTMATVNDGDTTDKAAEYSATVDWGDGTAPSTGVMTDTGPGSYSVQGSHSYAEEGTYSVKVHVTDSDSSNSAAATSTSSVTDASLASQCAMPAFIAQTYGGPTAGFNDSASSGNPADFTASITWGDGASSTGTVAGGPGLAPYTVSGGHTYATTGPVTVTTTILDDGGAKTVANCTLTVFAFGTSSGATFVIGDLAPTGNRAALPGDTVTWWGSQWAKLNPMTGGPPPSSMKGFAGFEDMPATPTCGSNWTTDPGNSTPPPSTVPNDMGVIVSSHVTQNGSVISGDVKHVVIVRNNPGYGPNPGSPGTGTVLGYLC